MIGFSPQLNIVTWSSLVHSLMMHLHTDIFPVYGFETVCVGKNRLLRLASQAALGHLIELEQMGFLQLLTADMFSYGALVLLLSAVKVKVVKTSRSLPCVQDDITVHRMHHAAHVTREDGWNLPPGVPSTQVRASPP